MQQLDDVLESEVNNLLASCFSDFSNQELKSYLDDPVKLDAKLDELVNNSSMLKHVQAQKEYMIVHNSKQAELSLNRQPCFEEMKEFLMNLNRETIALNESVNSKLEKLRKFYDHYSLESLHAIMETNLRDAEDESEKIVNQFLNKEINLDKFLKDYINQRTELHLRRIKTERFTSLVYKNLQFKSN